MEIKSFLICHKVEKNIEGLLRNQFGNFILAYQRKLVDNSDVLGLLSPPSLDSTLPLVRGIAEFMRKAWFVDVSLVPREANSAVDTIAKIPSHDSSYQLIFNSPQYIYCRSFIGILMIYHKGRRTTCHKAEERATKLLVTLRDRVEEGRRFSNEENDPMTSKELNDEPYEVKISCTLVNLMI
ncbi:hypothetical protein GQ457_06G001510 [Hibiscus cannabinus]